MFNQLAILGLGATELIIILLIILLLFGSRKLPELSRSVGQSMSELRKGLNDGKKSENKEKEDKSA